MPTIISFLPNGEYIQGHIRREKGERKERVVDSSPSGLLASLREQMSAQTPPPQDPSNAEIEPWERRGTKYFGVGASIWTLHRTAWNGYLFRVRYYDGNCCTKWIEGRGIKRLLLANLEPMDTEYDRIFKVTTDTYVDGFEGLAATGNSLGSSSVDILAAPLQRKKCLSMTRSMARNIRNGCYLMEQRHGQRNLSFLTLTVPGLSADGMAQVHRNWGAMVNKLFKWVRQLWLDRTGEQAEYVYCTEIQLKRAESTGVLAPHLHAVLRGRRHARRSWVLSYLEVRQQWAKILSQYVGEQFDTDALENLQAVEKSAGAYLGKYMGKGQGAENLPDLRTHWGGMSRNLSRLIKSATTVWRTDRGQSGYIHGFLDAQERLVRAGLIKSYKKYWVDLSDGVRVVDVRDGREYGGAGFWVGSGVLSTSTYCGGVIKVVSYMYNVLGVL